MKVYLLKANVAHSYYEWEDHVMGVFADKDNPLIDRAISFWARYTAVLLYDLYLKNSWIKNKKRTLDSFIEQQLDCFVIEEMTVR